jgi:hypothetical protein
MTMRVFGGWATFADTVCRVDVINRQLKVIQAEQVRLAIAHRHLTEESCYIRRETASRI